MIFAEPQILSQSSMKCDKPSYSSSINGNVTVKCSLEIDKRNFYKIVWVSCLLNLINKLLYVFDDWKHTKKTKFLDLINSFPVLYIRESPTQQTLLAIPYLEIDFQRHLALSKYIHICWYFDANIHIYDEIKVSQKNQYRHQEALLLSMFVTS